MLIFIIFHKHHEIFIEYIFKVCILEAINIDNITF